MLGGGTFFVAGEGYGEKLTNGESAHVLSVNEARERKFFLNGSSVVMANCTSVVGNRSIY